MFREKRRLSLLDKITDSEGNLIKDYTPEISSHIDGTALTWDTVQQGMRECFISYAPYDNPEICVTVNIPYGYSSSNAANIAKYVYKYCHGFIGLESIVNAGALDAAKVNIRD